MARQLDPMQYQVARHAATERAFTGKYWDHFDDGRYRCVGCGTPLFESGTKFDAGCGWPSYWEPVNSEVVERVRDASHGMVRVEVRCRAAARTWAMSSRRPGAHRRALLHQLGGHRLRAAKLKAPGLPRAGQASAQSRAATRPDRPAA
jgi:hypothetical protein